MSIIAFKDVSFRYDGAFRLLKMNFSIEEGQFVGIIGPNGSGKTTLLKLMTGLLSPAEGEVEIDRSLIAYVPQSIHLDRKFPISVMEIVLSGRLKNLPWYGWYSKADRAIAEEALATVNLSHLKEQSFGTLSTGQAQRTLIARALASKPKVLILDEPTASVDAASAADIYRLLKSFSGKLTIVMVTHDLRTVIQDADKILVVQEGVRALNPEEVCEHFAYGLYHTPMIPEAH